MARHSHRLAAGFILAATISACKGSTVESREGGDQDLSGPGPALSASDRVPLTELRRNTYLGFEGGLYPGGAIEPPPDHVSAGRAALRQIKPLDRDGRPSPNGKIVLVSVGMSNTSQEFCWRKPAPSCDPWTFMGQAAVDPVVNRSTLVIVNGARGGQSAETWDAPSRGIYDLVRDERLRPLGLTERQIQIAWVKQANPRPTVSLPDRGADAFQLEVSLGNIVRAMKTRWPNLRIVFFSSRTYGGYATSELNPEPYAYESGFSVKWVIEAQIAQSRTGRIDPQSGDLAPVRTPWLGWGPYLWADGLNPRADGLVWRRSDFETDGTHPSRSGEEKVGRLLLDFFKSSPAARCWFLAGRQCS